MTLLINAGVSFLDVMSGALCVLALDAADYELAKQLDCDNMLQERHDSIEVYAHGFDVPQTTEIWPTVATGLGPEDHGLSRDVKKWNNPLLRRLSTVTALLPTGVRSQLGRIVQSGGATRSVERTDSEDHPFDELFGWPGLTSAEHLQAAWGWLNQAKEGELTVGGLDRRLRANTGQEFGWLASMSQTDAAVVGAHSHVLDVAGHLYADQPDRLQAVYEWVDDLLGWLRDYVDKLVVMSDHGIENEICGDEHPGKHSWRAMISTQGISEPLPESVYDVREWLESNVSTRSRQNEEYLDAGPAREHLADLGYLDE